MLTVKREDVALRPRSDEIGRAYWADTGARITAADVVTCDDVGEPNVPLIDVLIEHGLWVLCEGYEVLVTGTEPSDGSTSGDRRLRSECRVHA